MIAIQSMTERVAEIAFTIKALEKEKTELIDQISFKWSIGELDEYLDDKGNAIVESLRIERRSRTTWSYSPMIKSMQEQEQHSGLATFKTTNYICVSYVKQK